MPNDRIWADFDRCFAEIRLTLGEFDRVLPQQGQSAPERAHSGRFQSNRHDAAPVAAMSFHPCAPFCSLLNQPRRRNGEHSVESTIDAVRRPWPDPRQRRRGRKTWSLAVAHWRSLLRLARQPLFSFVQSQRCYFVARSRRVSSGAPSRSMQRWPSRRRRAFRAHFSCGAPVAEALAPQIQARASCGDAPIA